MHQLYIKNKKQKIFLYTFIMYKHQIFQLIKIIYIKIQITVL